MSNSQTVTAWTRDDLNAAIDLLVEDAMGRGTIYIEMAEAIPSMKPEEVSLDHLKLLMDAASGWRGCHREIMYREDLLIRAVNAMEVKLRIWPLTPRDARKAQAKYATYVGPGELRKPGF